jgi:hypothetical protein
MLAFVAGQEFAQPRRAPLQERTLAEMISVFGSRFAASRSQHSARPVSQIRFFWQYLCRAGDEQQLAGSLASFQIAMSLLRVL